MSPELTTLLQSWINWIEAGAPEAEPFRREDALCYIGDQEMRVQIGELFEESFPIGQRVYPFNEDKAEYWLECENGTHYLNPARIAWVRAVLAEPTK